MLIRDVKFASGIKNNINFGFLPIHRCVLALDVPNVEKFCNERFSNTIAF